MVQYVTGASPVTFISEDTGGNAGTQYQIPLPLISYNTPSTTATSSPVIFTGWPPSTPSVASSDVTLAQTLVLTMINEGMLTLTSSKDA
jgi:hypothetical protein